MIMSIRDMSYLKSRTYKYQFWNEILYTLVDSNKKSIKYGIFGGLKIWTHNMFQKIDGVYFIIWLYLD